MNLFIKSLLVLALALLNACCWESMSCGTETNTAYKACDTNYACQSAPVQSSQSCNYNCGTYKYSYGSWV